MKSLVKFETSMNQEFLFVNYNFHQSHYTPTNFVVQRGFALIGHARAWFIHKCFRDLRQKFS